MNRTIQFARVAGASLTKTAGAASLALLTLSGAALAEGNQLEWSVTATGTSDYMFRGISFNNEDPAFQASFDLTYGIWYGSLWGSMVDGVGYQPVELNIITGITPKLGPVTFDFGLVYYFYPWADGASDSDLVEFKAGLEFSPIANLTINPIFWYIPDQDPAAVETYTYEANISYELPAVGIFTPTISGLIGHSEADDLLWGGVGFETDDYTYWNAGLSLAVEKFTFDFRYWDTDVDAPGEDGLADERFVFTTSITLP